MYVQGHDQQRLYVHIYTFLYVYKYVYTFVCMDVVCMCIFVLRDGRKREYITLQFVANHGRGEYPERQGQPECQVSGCLYM